MTKSVFKKHVKWLQTLNLHNPNIKMSHLLITSDEGADSAADNNVKRGVCSNSHWVALQGQRSAAVRFTTTTTVD